jgi:hypothetical protein
MAILRNGRFVNANSVKVFVGWAYLECGEAITDALPGDGLLYRRLLMQAQDDQPSVVYPRSTAHVTCCIHKGTILRQGFLRQGKR